MTRRQYEIPLLDVVVLDAADLIATSDITVLPSDDEEGFGPLIPI